MSTATATPPATTYNVGDVVEFAGYSQALPEGMEPIFTPGQQVKLLAPGDGVTDGSSFKAALVENEETQDTVFVEEIKAIAAAPAPARARTAPAKPAAAPVAAAKPAAAVKAAAPAKPAAAPAKPAAAAKSAPAAAKAAPAKPAAAPAAAKPAPAKPAAAPAAKPAAAKAAAKPAAKPATAKKAEADKAAKAAKKAADDAAKQAKKDADAAAKKAADELAAQPPPDTEAVTLAITESGNDALEAAKAVSTNIKEQFFTLGGILSHVYRENLHLAYETAPGVKAYEGEGGFERYLVEQLDVSYRKGMSLIDIYETTTKLGVDPAPLVQLGWAKAQELVRVVNADNYAAETEKAASMTVPELKEHIKTTRVSNTDGTGRQRQARTSTSKKTKFPFVLFDDEAALALQALAAAKTKADTEDDNKAFHFIVTEWFSLQDGNEMTLEQHLEALGNKFGVQLGVVPAETATGAEEQQQAEA